MLKIKTSKANNLYAQTEMICSCCGRLMDIEEYTFETKKIAHSNPMIMEMECCPYCETKL